MCRLRSLLIGGCVVLGAVGLTASSALTSLVVDGMRPSPSGRLETQSVDRLHKTDRLRLRDASRGGEPAQRAPVTQPAPILDGCSPAFSPLSSWARLNYPARCVADNTLGANV